MYSTFREAAELLEYADHQAAARVIQALLRGWMTRRRFRRELARYYAEGGGEAGRRHGFFAQRISMGPPCIDEYQAKSDQENGLHRRVLVTQSARRES